jgi:DNA-directed RNA polymerase subunit K/omega
MIELPEDFDSVFRYIVVVSQRAEQLINGARARAESDHFKPTLSAKDDVDLGHVSWRILTQEELDAQRQAVVDQYRAEVSAEGGDEGAEGPIPDVLPTAAAEPGDAAAAVGEGDQDHDSELARLQRLLGMAGGDLAAAGTGGTPEPEPAADAMEHVDESAELDVEDDADDADEEDE